MNHSPSFSRGLLRRVCYHLRHDADDSRLHRDEQGFVSIAELHQLVQSGARQGVVPDRQSFGQFLERQMARFEVRDGRVRARYGHSTAPPKLAAPEIPPAILFHGTCQRWWEAIDLLGLRPMGRRYVHLTADLVYARSIAVKAEVAPLVVRVDAHAAHAEGIPFWRANRHVWLAEAVPATYLSVAWQAVAAPVAPAVRQQHLERFKEALRTPVSAKEPSTWYHICRACTASWFGPAQWMRCPRCGRRGRASEQRTPPWQQQD